MTSLQAYPRTLPFSAMVIGMSEQTRAFVRGSLSFMEHLTLSQSEVEDTGASACENAQNISVVVRRKTNVILERLCVCLRNIIQQNTLSLVQLVCSLCENKVQSILRYVQVQIVINAAYLERSCEALDTFVSRAVGTSYNQAVTQTRALGFFLQTKSLLVLQHKERRRLRCLQQLYRIWCR